MRRDPTTLPGRPCSLAAALDVVGDRWALLVVREVAYGNHQFSQIARNTGAPRDRLTARLKDLVAAGVLTRGTGRHDGYHLTEAGRDLSTAMRALLDWGDRWVVTTPPVRLCHHDHELHAKTVCATCGEDVHGADVSREQLTPGWTIAGRETP
ncbi:helix-turn-helix domain-containing protein [Actinophytocola sp.]|jgi:DNA-binding HxlR family transcriptional regulator|uniref:winged helix-turn-helix transcriptional regulator n=1 Tax=Actinophytocola sp. TaxID=1872138 RepID=UPI002D2B3D1D|nr:helix-turn-helix domain-containing protein [Actinophytocola sp.]HYQ62444.1 helix-turn-helix domain-containing protein [Actinophytocola sp.]